MQYSYVGSIQVLYNTVGTMHTRVYVKVGCMDTLCVYKT